MEPSIKLTTLGAAKLTATTATGDEQLVFGPGKPFAVITYMTLTPSRPTTRDHLIDLLWTDTDPERARRTLRQTLWQIRAKLGENAIEARDETLTLTVKVTTDRDEFVDALRAGKLGRALELYTGPFLPDFAVPGGVEFEHWADLERDRLHLAWLRTAESQVRTYLSESRNRDALQLARALRDSDPLKERGWRLLLEVLVSTGDPLEAQLAADALEATLAAEGREPEPATKEAIRHTKDSAEVAHAAGPPSLMSELIGRSDEFASIVHAWDVAKHGPAHHIHITAAAGIGKTRLLQDVTVRLRASGASTVQLRGNFGERQVPYALAGDLARALARLPGAVGISQPAASALVGLDPSLSRRFATATGAAHGYSTLRHRTVALVEMLTAITEEEPLALLVDDIHWVDPDSRKILSGILSRMEAHRLLVVSAARPTGASDVETDRTERVALSPLGTEEVEELLLSLGNIPDPQLATELPATLHRTSGGSPLLVLETLQLALDRDLVTLDDGEWKTRDYAALLQELEQGHALGRRLEELDAHCSRTLLTLAVAGTPLTRAVIGDAQGRGAVGVERDLTVLEHRGFVARTGDDWEPAHDEILQAILAATDADTLRTAHAGLGRALAARPGPTLHALTVTARHLAMGGEETLLAGVFTRWVREATARGDRRRHRELVVALLGEEATPARIRHLLRTLPLHRRLGITTPFRAAAVAAAVIIALLFPTVPALLAGLGGPTKLAVTSLPLTTAPSALQLVPAPVVEIQSASGAVVEDATDSVTATIVNGDGTLSGTTTVAAVAGRAIFDDLRLAGSGAFVLRFTADRLKAVATTPIQLGNEARRSHLRLVRAELNGVTLSPADPSLRVATGDTISGQVEFRYSSLWGAAAVMLGAAPAWGDRTTNVSTLGPLMTPAANQVYSARLQFAAPRAPGVYHIIFAFQAEPTVDHIFSATNWVVGQPVWNDGNDIVDWSEEQIAAAKATGNVVGTQLRADKGRARNYFPATAIKVVVQVP